MKRQLLFIAFVLAVAVMTCYSVNTGESNEVVKVQVADTSPEHSDLISFDLMPNYIATETGEVIPEFVPGEIGEVVGYSATIFRPPLYRPV